MHQTDWLLQCSCFTSVPIRAARFSSKKYEKVQKLLLVLAVLHWTGHQHSGAVQKVTSPPACFCLENARGTWKLDGDHHGALVQLSRRGQGCNSPQKVEDCYLD